MSLLFLVVFEGRVIIIIVFCFGGDDFRRVFVCLDNMKFLVL